MLRENASHRRAEEDEMTRQARLVGLRENACQRLAEEDETMRQARLAVLREMPVRGLQKKMRR